MTSFRKLTLATTLTTIGVIGAGGLVRATGSGDGCPDWPRCFGRWIPPLDRAALIEYAHRTIGAVAITLLIVTAVVAVRRHRGERRLTWPLLAAVPVILGQAALGAVIVEVKTNPSMRGLEAPLVTFHIATAMALVGALAWVTVHAWRPEPAPGSDPRTARLARWSAVGLYVLILLGAYVRGEHAGLAFADWPLMDGRLIPALSGASLIHFLHRAAAGVVAVLVGWFAVRAWKARERDPAVAALGAVAAALMAAQIVVGAAQVWSALAWPAVAAHVLLSSAVWATMVAAAALAGRPAGAEEAARARDRIKAYVALTKPRIVLLLLVTTVPTMLVAARGMPSLWLIGATLFGGTLAAGSANTFNCYIDRDIDSVMRRTKDRPLPAHRVTPPRALVFGTALGVASFAWLTITVNLLSAVLATSAILFYVFVYTLALKRTTPSNIVIGGAAGAVPVLVGWSAVTGRVGLEAVVLFAIVFLWTPPHFWALALRHAADYAAAGIPMMPVVKGAQATHRRIVAYSLATVAVTLLLWPVAGMGLLYLVASFGLGAWFVRHAVVLARTGTPRAAMGLFRYSINYLALLFVAMGLDAALLGAS